MKISARNILKGRVVTVNKGASNNEALIELPGDSMVTTVNTNQPVEAMGLRDGGDANVITRAANGIIAVNREKHVNC